jgi:hypothetical protein
MRAEYDFSHAVRGKYYKRAIHGSNVVLLDPDVHGSFPDSASVNAALRELIRISRASAGRRRPAPATRA